MTTPLSTFIVKDPLTVRDDYLRVLKSELIQRGVTNPQVGPNSDYYAQATAFGIETGPLYGNQVVSGDAQMPDTATGANLVRVGAIFGLAPRNAVGSVGFISLSSSASIFIAVGTQLLDSAGLRYQVSIGGTYANGAQVPIAAIDGGSATNHAPGDVLRWTSPPAFCAPTAVVANTSVIFNQTQGLTGGSDAENDNSFRQRLLARLQNSPGAGNWQQVSQLAIASTPSVQMAFVYPAVNGPSTVHVAAVGFAQQNVQTSTAYNRDIASATMTGTVIPYIQGQLAEYVESVITTVTNVATDVQIIMSLPASPAASPPGPGGGWVDGSPFPSSTDGGSNRGVSSVTTTTRFLVYSQTTPQANVSHVCFLDPNTWVLNTAKVIAVNNGASPWDVTIDTPWPNIAVGSYVFPAAINTQTYVTTWLTSMALMGPGEKTSNVSVLTRGFRHPLPTLSWPYSLGGTQLKQLISSGIEVLDAQYGFRSTTTPAVPGSVANPPNILVPRNIGFYAI